MTPDIEVDWLKRWALYSPDSVALQSGETGRQFTYRELYRRAGAIARHLSERFRIGPGDRVAAVLQNELDYVSLFFATQRLGAILVPVNFRFTGQEISYICRDSAAKLVVAESLFWSSVVDLQSEMALWNFESLVEVAEQGTDDSVPFVGAFEDPCMICTPRAPQDSQRAPSYLIA